MQKFIFYFLFLVLSISGTSSIAQQISTLNLFFETDSFSISQQEQIKLVQLVKSLDALNIMQISISAYCDDIGKKQYNEILSEKRANKIRDLMLGLKVDKRLILETEGKGQLQITGLSDKDTTQQRAFNRRAEIRIEYELIPKKMEPSIRKTVNDFFTDSSRVGDKITLENILFIGGQHNLLSESYVSLDKLIRLLKEKKEYHIIILGHVCCLPYGQDGTDMETGLKNLSVARAKAIYDYLIDNGIESNRLDYKGLKSNFPTGRNPKYDRRVEIEISNITKK